MLQRLSCLLVSALVALIFSQAAFANGTLTHFSGQVSVQKADGSTVAASPGVQVLPGDTLLTGIDGFVRMQMTDGGEMVLRPNSHLKIEKYTFDKDKPKEDSFVFKVLQGGFRTVTGLISKRGDPDAYRATTPDATIGIRGTQLDLRVCNADCGALSPGTYVAVRYGAVVAKNSQGSLDFKAGQVAYVPSNQPPVLLPHDPGVGFTPPPSIPKLDEKKKKEKEAADSNANGDKKEFEKKDNDKKEIEKKDDKKDGDKKDTDKKDSDKKEGDSKDKAGSGETKDGKSQDRRGVDNKGPGDSSNNSGGTNVDGTPTCTIR